MAIAAAIGGFALYRATRHTTAVIPSTNPQPTPQPSNGPNSSSNDKTQGSTPAPSPTEQPAPTSPAELKAPSGSFVSNHRPSISGNESPSAEQSTCNTTSGATCEIQFRKGNDTRTLPAQVVDAEGNTYWNWDIVSAGLSVGKWKVTAIAKQGDKSLTTTDQLELDVQP